MSEEQGILIDMLKELIKFNSYQNQDDFKEALEKNSYDDALKALIKEKACEKASNDEYTIYRYYNQTTDTTYFHYINNDNQNIIDYEDSDVTILEYIKRNWDSGDVSEEEFLASFGFDNIFENNENLEEASEDYEGEIKIWYTKTYEQTYPKGHGGKWVKEENSDEISIFKNYQEARDYVKSVTVCEKTGLLDEENSYTLIKA
jgi:hypothetical protein